MCYIFLVYVSKSYILLKKTFNIIFNNNLKQNLFFKCKLNDIVIVRNNKKK